MSEESKKTTVAIVDDHLMVAEGVALLMNHQADIEVVGIASTGAEAERLVIDTEPDVVIMDFNLPDIDGIQATANIMARRPETTVIMFSSEQSTKLLASAVEAGCAGFVSKTQNSNEIVAAVRAASRGESIVPASVVASLLTHMTAPKENATQGLTSRELEVLTLVARGDATDRIASSLYLSSHTVRNHVRNILMKLGAHSKLEAVAMAARLGIVSLSDDPHHS